MPKPAILTLILALLSAFGCVREADIDLPDLPTRIVALSHFTVGKPIQVEVSLSQKLTDAGDPVVPFNADVSIAVGGQFLDKLFRVTGDDGRFFWQSRDLVQVGTEYSLGVRIGGFETVEAVSYAPKHIPISEMRIDTGQMRVTDLDDGRRVLRVPLEIQLATLPNQRRYFAFALRHEIESFEVINGEPIPDEYYDVQTKFLADGRTLALVYDTPEQVVLINENYWGDGRAALVLDAIVPFDPTHERPRRIFVEWRTLSEEFYRYHLSLARQGNNLPLNDPDALYNNIIGGLGNFSGYSVSEKSVVIPNTF
ncbi:MAG: DUF4249 domain-containing protein [Saprospiraceae bacterium]